MVFITNSQSGLAEISRRSWIFLILSGVATGASWPCYYRALQTGGDTTAVVAIDKLSIVFTLVLAVLFLRDAFTRKSIVGVVLIVAGPLFMVIK